MGRGLVLGVVCLFSAAGCTDPAFAPGYPDYPTLNRDPQKPVPITGHAPEGWIVNLFANYDPVNDRVNDPKTGVANCARGIGPGANRPYHVSVDLPATWDGSSFTSNVAIDRFEEGRCGWHFTGLEARIRQRLGAPINFGGLSLGLAGPYSPANQAHPVAPHQIDVWCYFETHANALKCVLAARLPSPLFNAIPVSQRGNPEDRPIATGTSSLIANIHDLDAEAKAYRITTTP